jgi:hypothetical protein
LRRRFGRVRHRHGTEAPHGKTHGQADHDRGHTGANANPDAIADAHGQQQPASRDRQSGQRPHDKSLSGHLFHAVANPLPLGTYGSPFGADRPDTHATCWQHRRPGADAHPQTLANADTDTGPDRDSGAGPDTCGRHAGAPTQPG